MKICNIFVVILPFCYSNLLQFFIMFFFFVLCAVSFASNEEIYHGITIQVSSINGSKPKITLGTVDNANEDSYCLTFKYLFESQDYDITAIEDGEFSVINGTEIDLSDANCQSNTTETNPFHIICDQVNGAILTLTFELDQDSHGILYKSSNISFCIRIFTNDPKNR